MSKYRVTPRQGGKKAAYQVVNIDNNVKNPHQEAEKLVKSNSRLGQIDSWWFESEKI